MNLIKSKIFWAQVVGLVIAIVGSLSQTYPEYAVIIGVVINLLTVILRFLQGKEITVGSTRVKL